ncbi:hypothetical protein A5791_13165 [Mycobacterium sp. 852002-51163_SCH5372311]|nr:hypothetical protein A5791_13165 [Mycobacterium sp. 852002-51163_SCH5372311]
MDRPLRLGRLWLLEWPLRRVTGLHRSRGTVALHAVLAPRRPGFFAGYAQILQRDFGGRRGCRWSRRRRLDIALLGLKPLAPVGERVERKEHARWLPFDPWQFTGLAVARAGPGSQLGVDYRPRRGHRPVGRLVATYLPTSERDDKLRNSGHGPIIRGAGRDD